MKIKILKNNLGEYGIWWGDNSSNGKTVRLGYRRFFRDKKVAERWAKKLEVKLTTLH